MKRTMAQIGYIAGLMERRGKICEMLTADRGISFTFGSLTTAKYVTQVIGGKLLNRPKKCGKSWSSNHVYVSASNAIGWFMTCYSIVSPETKERIEHAVMQWKSRGFHGVKNRPAPCHPDRPLHAKGKCQMCYARERRGTLYVNVKIGGPGQWD